MKIFAVALGLLLSLFAFDVRGQDVPSAEIVAARDTEGVTVRYRLSEPRTRLVFTTRDTNRDRWTVTTPGLTLADGTVSGDRPFDAFELRILPDAAERDRIYIGLTLVGDGRLLYGPALMIEGIRVGLSFDLGPGEASLPDTRLVYGYGYVGPQADITTDSRGDMVSGLNVPADLAEILRHSFFESMAFYEARLGPSLSSRPVLVGSVDSPGPFAFRGDVTNTGVISVRFHGDTWREQIDTVAPFVWHETFHLWNRRPAENADGNSAPWLSEGGAEYAALVGAVSTGALDEAAARLRIIQRVNGCRRLLESRDMDPARLQSGSGPYDCGVLVQWIADLESRKAGTGDILTLWKTILDAGRNSATSYGVREFRALLGADSAVAVVLEGPGSTRWASLQARLSDLGVSLENRPDDRTLRGTALMHIAELNCRSGSYGFYDNPGELKLDGSDCGVLSGEPIIDTVEGHDPQTASRAMFDAVQARCGTNLPVRYAARDGRILEAVCDRPLVEPEVWAIADAPPLSVSDETSRPL